MSQSAGLNNNFSTGTTNMPGYIFDIIGFDQWLSVSVKYSFNNVDGTPNLQLNFAFDASPYSISAGDERTQKLTEGLTIFKIIHYQLSWQYATDEKPDNPTSVLAHTAYISLLPAAEFAFTAQHTDALLNFTNTIITWFEQAIGSEDPVSNTAPIICVISLPISGLQDDKDIFELDVKLSVTRTDEDYTPIYINILPAIPAKNDQLSFAENFELIFKTTDSELKLATGISELSNNANQLWVIRLATAASAKGIYYHITNNAIALAPMPVSKTLLSGNIITYPYTTKQGINWDAATNQTLFENIDLDVWLKNFLQNIDTLISGDSLNTFTSIYKLQSPDDTDPLESILTEKTALVNKLLAAYYPVISGEVAHTDTIQIQQQLISLLSNFYTGTAILQYKTSLTTNSDTAAFTLQGKIIPISKFNDASFSDAQITNEAEAFTSFTVYANTPDKQSYLPINVSFQPNQINYSFANGSTIPLCFIINPAGQELSANVPVVIREYPKPVNIIKQYAEKAYDEAVITLDKVKQWDYTAVYLPNIIAQDDVETTITFNETPDKLIFAGTNTPSNLFEDLAQFVTVYPIIKADIDTYLPLINSDSTANTDAYQVLYPALTAVNQLIKKVADSLVITNEDEAFKTASQQSNYAFTLTKAPVSPSTDTRLLVKVSADKDKGNNLKLPWVLIDGYEVVVQDTLTTGTNMTIGYTYRSANNEPLLMDDKISAYKIKVGEFNILDITNLNLLTAVSRNKSLLPDNNNGYQVTDNRFVYQSAEQTRADSFVPATLNWDSVEFDLKNLAPAQDKLSIDKYLALLFALLLSGENNTNLKITINITYQYKLGEDVPAFWISLPVALLPAMDYQTGNIEMLSIEISAELNAFIQNANPNEIDARFNFDITILTSPMQQNTPALRMPNVCLNLSDVSLDES